MGASRDFLADRSGQTWTGAGSFGCAPYGHLALGCLSFDLLIEFGESGYSNRNVATANLNQPAPHAVLL